MLPCMGVYRMYVVGVLHSGSVKSVKQLKT